MLFQTSQDPIKAKKYLSQRKVLKSEKSLYIRETSPNQRKISTSEKSLKIIKLIMLMPSKPNDIRLLLLLLLLLKHSLNPHNCQIH